jgi:glutamyl-tRNA synthetase
MRHLRPHGSSLPRYWHTPLWRDGAGERLSKRQGGTGLADLRARGLDAAAVLGLLAASLDLVPPATRLSSTELLQEQSLPRLQALLRQTPVAQDAAST